MSQSNRGNRYCVVTGGAGFIGSHLVDRLIDDGAFVVVADNLSTGRPNNLAHLLDHPRFRFVEVDVSDLSRMAPLVEPADELYHLASYVGVKLASQTSSQTILNNLRSIDTILELVTRYRPRMLLTSTSEIYGKALDFGGSVQRLDEGADRVYGSTEVHRWSYAGVKSVEEFLTLAKYHEEGVESTIIRLFNVIGPRQIGMNGPVVPRLVQQALLGQPLTVYGTGNQLRCFTDVDEAIAILMALMKRDDTTGEVYNVGNDRPTTILELAKLLVELTDSGSEIEFVPHESVYGEHFEDVTVRIPDVSKVRKLTGMECRRPLRETLERVVISHRKILERT